MYETSDRTPFREKPKVTCTFPDDKDRPCEFSPVITEQGICYGFNNAPMNEVFVADNFMGTFGEVFRNNFGTELQKNVNNQIQNKMVARYLY